MDSDSKENAEPDASSAIPPDVDSGHGKEVDEDDGVPFLEVNFRPALCPGCQKAFQSPWQMGKHSCVSSADGEARCPFCPDRNLTSKEGVIHHLAYQHFNHRFLCKECNVTNAYKCYLLKHYATRHTDMHQCPVKGCPFIFKKGINLTRHLQRTHTKSSEENFAPSMFNTPLAKPSASTSVSHSIPVSAPIDAKKDIAANSKTSDITLTSYAYVSTPPPVSSGAASCDANSGQKEQDFVDMGDGMSSFSDSPDPLPMSFAEDDDEDKDKGEGIMLSEINVQFAQTLEPLDLSITSQVNSYA